MTGMVAAPRRRGRVHRPLLRYHGGKFKIAPWVIQYFPAHRTYVEAFGGAASCLLRKPRSTAEIYNDLNETVVQLFRICRDPDAAAELVRQLRMTPYARKEFKLAYEETEDPIERARRTIVRSFMGYGSDGTDGKYPTGFRATMTGTYKMPALEWGNYPDALETIIQRLVGVVIESSPAIDVMKRLDSAETLHYADPPYLPETRSQGNRRRGKGFHVYAHEMDDKDHIQLLDELDELEGMVILSGYPSELYKKRLSKWQVFKRGAYADGARPRTECLWLNENCQRKLIAEQSLRSEGTLDF